MSTRLTALAAAIVLPLGAGSAQMPPGMAGLRAEQGAARAADHIIPYGKDAQQFGELRLPEGPGPFPVAVVIHGGCWVAAVDTVAGVRPLAEALRSRGIATWSIEYRRLGNPGGGWPGTFTDVSMGVDHLSKLAKRHKLDLSRVSVVGHSAGAHLALWAASRPRLPAPWSRVAAKPRSVAAIDGPAALAPFVGADQQVCGRPVITELMGGAPATRAAEYALASPAAHLPLGVDQLLVAADLGFAVKPYAAAARAAGDTVELLEPVGANHFDIITPGTVNGAAVADRIAAQLTR
jgi:acetyl esterase/lipase